MRALLRRRRLREKGATGLPVDYRVEEKNTQMCPQSFHRAPRARKKATSTNKEEGARMGAEET